MNELRQKKNRKEREGKGGSKAALEAEGADLFDATPPVYKLNHFNKMSIPF